MFVKWANYLIQSNYIIMSSLKKNILYNSIRVGSNLVFPLVTFPYVTRIMGPDTLGLFNYITAIVAYFTLFAGLGFPLYGTREVAQAKEDKFKLQSVTNAIFSANLISCIVVYIAFFVTSLFLYEGEVAFWLYLIIGFSILLSCISLDWFFQGVEDFKYITVRSIIIKIISVACLYIFVKDKNDIVIYAILTVMGTCGNNLLNLIRINKYVKLRFTFRDCIKHVKGASVLFLGSIAVSLYTSLNSIMVGALGSMAAVAFFNIGNRLVQMLMTVLGAITSSIIPRMSYLVSKRDEEEVNKLQKKTLLVLLYISIPMMFGIIALADPIIFLFCGAEFSPSSVVMQILSPLLVIITLSGFVGHQVLIPLHKEKYGNYCVIGGAITNLSLNFFLIPNYAEAGVAISVVLSEIVVTIMHFYYARNLIALRYKDFFPFKCLLASIAMFIAIKVFSALCAEPFLCFLWAFIGMLTYFAVLFLVRDNFVNKLL